MSVTHPDVIDFGDETWGGWRYWMAFTPFPSATREDPSVVVSNDGETWVVPAGGPARLSTAQEAQALGYLWNSDTDLVLLPNGDLACYWRMYEDTTGNFDEALCRRTTSDGVTWAAREDVFLADGTLDANLSPTICVEDDDTLTMWTVSNAAGKLQRRTSADGVTWSAVSDCVIPAGLAPWHVDVVRRDGYYHALIDCLVGGNATFLAYAKSTDGVNFYGRPVRAVPLSGTAYDAGGRHYRSSFQPGSGPHLWDIWVTGLPENPLIGNNNPPDGNPWRFLLYRDFDLR